MQKIISILFELESNRKPPNETEYYILNKIALLKMSQTQSSKETTVPGSCKLIRPPSMDYTDQPQDISDEGGSSNRMDYMEDEDRGFGKQSYLGDPQHS